MKTGETGRGDASAHFELIYVGKLRGGGDGAELGEKEMAGDGNASLGFKKAKEAPLVTSVKTNIPVMDGDTYGRLVSRPMAVRHAIANGYKIGAKPTGIMLKETPVLVRPAGAAIVAKRYRDEN